MADALNLQAQQHRLLLEGVRIHQRLHSSHPSILGSEHSTHLDIPAASCAEPVCIVRVPAARRQRAFNIHRRLRSNLQTAMPLNPNACAHIKHDRMNGMGCGSLTANSRSTDLQTSQRSDTTPVRPTSAEASSKRHCTTEWSSTVAALSAAAGCQASARTHEPCTFSSALCCRGPLPSGMCQSAAPLTPSARYAIHHRSTVSCSFSTDVPGPRCCLHLHCWIRLSTQLGIHELTVGRCPLVCA